ncbi:hypothetical protein [Streptomyces sp. GQFP]|uniref:hypothetical protein n=1 Tax=Streptomyces sp. GQFP TaxID=2907545 RepID=UPI001F1FD642|nr:hypothetical protein [Streptomyces sp. GQFP]UIX34082.1 hypothetical protein LUX31_31045 [Streptomyces sp. GQFP]
MSVNRRAATSFVLVAVLNVVIGLVFTITEGRAFGAPLFWLSTGFFAGAWYFERKSAARD